VLAQLVPEVAVDVALRRRWVVDMQRIAALPVMRLAPTLALGPQPDPRDPAGAPPWRVRLDPPGETLDQVLRRAPLPDDQFAALGAELADALQSLHAAGAVLRDLDPRTLVVDSTGRIWFTDIGHARLAILSSRTASSLLLESSPYIAPEALVGTVVDARADIYSLGVVLWRALTGDVPFEASLLASRASVPDLSALRPDAAKALVALVTRCLAYDPEGRPPTARDVADGLRGDVTNTPMTVTRVTCQACGAKLVAGLRLCLACGKQAVQFHRTPPGDPDGVQIMLGKATEDAAFLAKLSRFYGEVATDVPRLNFMHGDHRMYGKAERAVRHALPAVLVADLEPKTGQALVKRLRGEGFKVWTDTPGALTKRRRRAGRIALGALFAFVGSLAVFSAGSAAAVGVLGLSLSVPTALFAWGRHSRYKRAAARPPLGQLRAAPAALPSSDAQVAAVASALVAAKSPDVRARLEELAILVQRLCDANAALADGATSDHAPIAGLIDLARRTAEAIEAVDRQLTTLDEGAIVRALARSEARGEAPALRIDLLAGLDTLRQLEDQRAALIGRLLEITSLARMAIERDLARVAERRSDDAEVARAFAALDAG
jgi:hypothetical protein